MNKFLIALATVSLVFLSSCQSNDLPPATQMQLQEIEQELAPYYASFDDNGDGILDQDELTEVPPDELARVEELTTRYNEIYQEGINQNASTFVQFLRGLGIPAPPGSEIAAGTLAALAFRRPRRQLIAALKHISPQGGGPSFYEAGRAFLSIPGLLDSTPASGQVAEEEVALINTEEQQLNG
jgi:hypothetical protein